MENWVALFEAKVISL